MNPLPTQYELATLAAAIPIPDCWKDDEDNSEEIDYRAHRALDLWRACGRVIADAPASLAAMNIKAEERRLFYSQFPEFSDGDSVPLDVFLKTVMPGKSLADSTQTWWNFRTRNLEGWGQISNRLKPDSVEGLPLAGLHIVCSQFLRFDALRGAIVASDKAAIAAAARHLPKPDPDAKSKAAKARKGRGYLAPELEPSAAEIAGNVVGRLVKIQKRKASAKKRLDATSAAESTPKQTAGTRKQEPESAKQKRPSLKQRK